MVLNKNTLLTGCLLFLVLLFSCSNMASDRYYIQQQERAAKDGSAGGGTVIWEEEETPASGGGGTLPSGTYSMFAALLTDGEINKVLFGGTAEEQARPIAALKEKLPKENYEYGTAKFDGWLITGTFSAANVPNLRYSGFGTWNGNSGSEQRYNGPNSSAGSNSITDMVYYRYKGYNPLFSPESAYNKAEYTKKDGTKERCMERFIFYRFTGKGGGVAALDNMLVAVDTYTKLVFAFAKPTKFTSLLGNQVPQEWGPVDLASTGPGGVKYKFYEYDPAGYVKEDGGFVMYDWYTSGMAAGNYDPKFTGLSPYLGTTSSAGGGGAAVGGGYAVSGSLTVKASWIKNVSMTDAWGDHGNGDGTDSPEFIWDVRSRAYSGFTQPAWDSLSNYKGDQTSIMPAAAQIIKVGQTQPLGGAKYYNFESVQAALSLELDSRIAEIDISGNDWVSDYEKPLVYLSYDRYTQKWKLAPESDNKTFLNGTIKYDKTFSLGIGETKDFILTLPTGYAQELQLCYTLTWESVTATGNGRIFSAELTSTTTDPQCIFSGDNGVYEIRYIDISKESADNTTAIPRISLKLDVANLDVLRPIRVETEIIKSEISPSFIKIVTLNNDPVGAASCNGSATAIDIQFDLKTDPTIEQKADLKVLFKDTTGYDTDNSPKEITITVIRERYVSMPPRKLLISNIKLKNISVWDVGGDSVGGGYSQSEFTWNIRSKVSSVSTGWTSFAVRNSPALIAIGNTVGVDAIQSASEYSFEDPRSGSHKLYIDAAISEYDVGSKSDIICKHEQPLLEFSYSPVRDSWSYTGMTAYNFTDSSDNKWKLVSVTFLPLSKGQTKTVKVIYSSYIYDLIWRSENIANWINGPREAGWGDVELSFDLSWENK